MMEHQTLLPLLGILLFLTSSWFVFHYAKRKTSIFIILLSILSFGMGSAAVALLPIDLSYASTASYTSSSAAGADADSDADNGGDNVDAKGNDYSNQMTNPTYLPWQITYWTTFLLAWFVLPITRESLLCGHFTLRQRFKNGLGISMRKIRMMMLAGIVAVIAMAVHLKSFHIVTIVLPVLMALSNTYGLVLVSLLLGNGLVNIPKRFWREACPANELRRLRIMAPMYEEELFEAVMGLEDVEDKIEEVCRTAVSLRECGEGESGLENEDGNVSIGTAEKQKRATRCGGGCCCKVDEVSEFHECLEDLVRRKNDTASLCAERRTRRGGGSNNGANHRNSRRSGSNEEGGSENNGGEVNTMDMQYLVSLSRQLKRAQENVTTAQLRWDHLMDHSRLFSALMDNDGVITTGSGTNDGSSTVGSPRNDTNLLSSSSSSPKCCHKVRYALQRLWIRYLRYPTYRAMALFTATLSIFVLLSEVTLAAPINLSPFSWTLKALDNYHVKNSTTQLIFQVCALIPLLYMSLCVYTCLFQMSLLGPYCLRGNRQSAGVALVFNAQYLVRLQFPLGYNYLLMLKYDMTHCAFNNIMSDMSTIPFFGTSFSVYAPILILVVCLFTLCDVYPRILRLLGVEHEDALLLGDKEELDGKVTEGIQLMRRDAERRGAGSPEKQSLNGQRNNIIV
eukprot:CAMPEP_0183720370 /NCGR_PEP_ID=MMETSP0737-20130205/12997_1 /TAXON_ID=385413 /ORGANISM="Thalassiosira miniscula, Strain CCMP1093" /LENGTH=678 /DNA_ID=CAMNT_0025950217 /DNA_START=368 /DNA_END=2404 /DNA_ORIENTATION=-